MRLSFLSPPPSTAIPALGIRSVVRWFSVVFRFWFAFGALPFGIAWPLPWSLSLAGFVSVAALGVRWFFFFFRVLFFLSNI